MNRLAEEEEDDGFALDPEQLDIFYEVLFKRIMDVMDNPNVNVNPFEDMVKILSQLSEIFSFKSMITIIPELIGYAIKYGMMVEKSYDEIGASSDEDEQGFGPEIEKAKKRSVIKKDVDKLRMFLWLKFIFLFLFEQFQKKSKYCTNFRLFRMFIIECSLKEY